MQINHEKDYTSNNITGSEKADKSNDRKPHMDKKKLTLKLLFLFSPIIPFIIYHLILYGIYTFPDVILLALLTFSPLVLIAILHIAVAATKSRGLVTIFQACTIAISSIPILLMFFYTYGFAVFSKNEIVGEIVFTTITMIYLIAVVVYFMVDTYRIVNNDRGSFSIKKTKNLVGGIQGRN